MEALPSHKVMFFICQLTTGFDPGRSSSGDSEGNRQMVMESSRHHRKFPASFIIHSGLPQPVKDKMAIRNNPPRRRRKIA
jgi:hypothetical protein